MGLYIYRAESISMITNGTPLKSDGLQTHSPTLSDTYAPIELLLQNLPNIQYAIIGIMIIFSTSLILGLVFVIVTTVALSIASQLHFHHLAFSGIYV